MNRDDIIRIGEQADEVADRKIKMRGEYHPDWHQVRDEAFAALVAAAERQACMEVCWDVGGGVAIACANLIRARGDEPKRHPGYIVGDHWLQTAYDRVCAGDSESEVMADYGYTRGKA